MKKILALVLAVMMLMAMSMSALAEDTTDTGKITITNASAGQIYTAYKIFDATYYEGAVAYTTNETVKDLINSAESAPFVVAENPDSEGRYAVQLATGADGEAVVAWIEDNLTSFTPTATETLESGNTVEFDVPYGYYYITSSLGTVVTVNTNTPSVEVVDKNITEPGQPDKTDDEVTAQIGDTVNFQVVFTATNYYKKDAGDNEGTLITEYYVEDTPDGYDIDLESLKVYVGESDITNTVVNAEIGDDGKLTFTIPWVKTESTGEGEDPVTTTTSLYSSPSEVTFTYSGTVNADAADGEATNTVKVNNNSDQTPFTDTENTKNYALTINKTDGENSLTGAEFELYRGSVAEENKVELVQIEGGYRVADDSDEDSTITTTIEAGLVTIKGLDGNDTYFLKEIKAPDGYNMLTDAIEVTFKTEAEEGVTEVVYANAEQEVVNNKGTELPSTGGIGTTLFYVIGGVLVAAAVVLLVTKKRMSAME